MRDHDSRSKGSHADESPGEDVEGRGLDPRQALAMRRITEARAYNRAHPDQVADFDRLTGGVASKGVRAIMTWQREHGVKGDGKIGPETLGVAATAAQAKNGDQASAGSGPAAGGEQRDGQHGDKQPAGGAGSHASAQSPPKTEHADADEGGGLADELVAGGSTESEEHRPKEDPEAMKEEGGRAASEGADHAIEATEASEGMGAAGKAGIRTAAQIARLPHVIHLVKAHKYKEAINYIRESLGYSDYVEVIKLVAEHVGLDVAELLPKITKIATIGAETADIVLVGLQFQYEALKALAEAKEKGERDNRIYLYATAWADGFLLGAHSNPGAITDEQREAVANGLREGKATAGALGERAAEVGKKVLEQYGTVENARRAVIDALLKHAGIEGVKLHEGK